MVQYGIPLRESLIDSVATGAVLAFAGFDITVMVKYYRPSAKNAFYVVVASVVLAALGCALLNWILKQLSSDADYLTTLKSTMLIRFVFIWLMTLILGIQGKVWWFIKEQSQGEQRVKETKRLMREAELSNLRQQLQPHFLFNSLNSISALTIAQPEQARKMIEQLSDFLRGTVRKDGNQLVSLREELHHLQLYLDIEKVRFGHRLITKISADESLLDMKLPSLLLQPVLENAIKFGLYDTIGEVVISLDAKTDQNDLLIEIKNPFDPETAAPKSGTGFGLSSVQRRLALIFYRNDLLSTIQKENIFITLIKVPQR
ncbi:MAG: histidine kinase [Bacteroidetes bacterium]|nr:histidine kinase [Bacteroidota bacterium]MBI3481970.1 histidine kinase [Bacteroidota bacterium]